MTEEQGHYLSGLEENLEQWKDERYLSRDALSALFKFTGYIVNLADGQDWTYDGHSWKEGTPLGCLVIKATMDDAPVVCFCSARSFLNSVKIFIRKLDLDVVDWRPDRYRA